ncbi:MAG TPA: hypothetical protein VFE24_17670 [Pirellulales bacterium]|nr:hypothetical protein [Pirellulales bacterium]
MAVCLGCQKGDDIRHYEVPLTQPRTAAKTPELPEGHPPLASTAPATEQTMLAALVPVDEIAWTFKTTGPMPEMAEFAAAFETFVKSVKFDSGTPKWALPAGWAELPGSQFRFATLRVPVEGQKPLEIAVNQITLTPDFVLDNVNRWRGQMSLPPLAQADLAKETKTVTIEAKITATMVQITGKLKAGGMGRPPFAPGGGNGQ